jgi:hypothetical protein
LVCIALQVVWVLGKQEHRAHCCHCCSMNTWNSGSPCLALPRGSRHCGSCLRESLPVGLHNTSAKGEICKMWLPLGKLRKRLQACFEGDLEDPSCYRGIRPDQAKESMAWNCYSRVWHFQHWLLSREVVYLLMIQTPHAELVPLWVQLLFVYYMNKFNSWLMKTKNKCSMYFTMQRPQRERSYIGWHNKEPTLHTLLHTVFLDQMKGIANWNNYQGC